MAVFTIQAPDGRKIKIQAGDEATAVRGAKEWATANPLQQPGNVANPSQAFTDAIAAASAMSLKGKVSDLPSRRPSLGDEVMSFGRGVIEGIPIAGPMLADARRGLDANLKAMINGGDAGQYQDEYKAADDELKAKTGGARTAGGIAGAIATLGAGGSTALGGKLLGMTGSLGSRVGMGMVSGGAISGADTLAHGGSLEDAGKSLLLGGALGGALPAAGGIMRNLGQKAAQSKAVTTAIANAPDAADLKKVASDLFESSRAAGVGVEGNKFATFAADLVNKAKAADIDEALDGDAIAAYRRMVSMAQEAMSTGSVSLSRLHNLRQIAQDVAVDATKDRTKRFAGQIVDGLDDLIENLQPNQFVGAGGKQAASDLMEGISTWSRAKKLGVIEEAIRKSDFQKSGVENGLRLQFLAILRDPKKVRLFDKTELAEIEKVAKGTIGNNILNLIGKFGFGLGNGGTNAVGGSIGALLGGVPGVLAASGARKGSQILTERAAERAAKVVATPNIPMIAAKAARPAMLAPAVLPLEVTKKRAPVEIMVKGGNPALAGGG